MFLQENNRQDGIRTAAAEHWRCDPDSSDIITSHRSHHRLQSWVTAGIWWFSAHRMKLALRAAVSGRL